MEIPKYEKFEFEIDELLLDELWNEAERRGVTASSVVETALRDYLKDQSLAKLQSLDYEDSSN
jgi:hypothetical protein